MIKKSGYIFKYFLVIMAISTALYLVLTCSGSSESILKNASASWQDRQTIDKENPFENFNSQILCNQPEVKLARITDGSNAVVEAVINGQKYPIRIDTGLGHGHFLIGSDIAQQAQLKTKPSNAIFENMTGGVCDIPIIRVGDIQFINPKTYYIDRQFFNFSGKAVFDERNYVSLGLEMLSEFKFIQFDNINRDVIIGLDNSFLPKGDFWKSWPMSIENDNSGNKRLFISISIEGNLIEIMFDSCGGKGLKISQSIWNSIKSGVNITSSGKEKIASLQFGQLYAERFELEKLDIGGLNFKDVIVYVRPDESEYIKNLISLDIFSNTSIVIDFENMQLLVWTFPFTQ